METADFHVAHVLEVELAQAVDWPAVNALLHEELGASHLQVLEVDRQAVDSGAVGEQLSEGVEAEAHLGEVDARDCAREASGHQEVGVLDADETRGAPFGTPDFGQRKLLP